MRTGHHGCSSPGTSATRRPGALASYRSGPLTGLTWAVSGPQSGRTTFARALITSLATRFRPGQAHFYVVEHQPGGLAEYSALPHCGGVFSPAEPDRIRRLVGWLEAETQRRAGARFDAS